MKKALRAAAVALGVVAAGLGAVRYFTREPAAPPPDLGAVPDFALTERSGRAVTRADLAGKVWVADFVFTRCMGPCPLLTRKLAGLQNDYDLSPDLRLVSFSVDPSYDTPAVLSEYAKKNWADEERWLFLTGETEAVYDLIGEGFRLAVQDKADPAADPNRNITHNMSFVLVDRAARIRGYYTGTDDAEMKRLRRDLRAVLKA